MEAKRAVSLVSSSSKLPPGHGRSFPSEEGFGFDVSFPDAVGRDINLKSARTCAPLKLQRLCGVSSEIHRLSMTLLRGFVTTVSRAASAFVEALDTLRRKLHATKSAQAAADAL